MLVKEREKRKYLPSEIYESMQAKGYKKFNSHQHMLYWKEKDAKNPLNDFGTQIAKTWYWYDNWLQQVERHCKESSNQYK